jgi:hypothetical protein
VEWGVALLFADQPCAPALEDAGFGINSRDVSRSARADEYLQCRGVGEEELSLRLRFASYPEFVVPVTMEWSDDAAALRRDGAQEAAP